MTTLIVIENLVKACWVSTLIREYVEKLKYTMSTKKFDCPVCKTTALKAAANKSKKLGREIPPVVGTYKKVRIFKHPSKPITIAACPCGYRKIRKPKGPSNPIDAATQGMIKAVKNLQCGCGATLPKGRKKFCYTCRPVSNKTPKEVVSQTTAVY